MPLFIGFKQIKTASKSVLRLLSIVLLFLYILEGTAVASEAELTNIVIRNLNDDLVVDLRIKGVFTAEMREAVLSGILVRFTFLILLDEVHDLWFDKKIAGIKTVHQIQYDALKNEFQITRAWEKGGTLVVKDPEAAQAAISEVSGLAVLPLAKLKNGRNYQLRVKSELHDKKFHFWSFPWEFETDWYTINFIY